MSDKSIGRFFALLQISSVTLGAGFYFHSWAAGILAFGVCLVVMERWQA